MTTLETPPSRFDLRFHQVALVAALVGGTVGVVASLLSLALHGRFAIETFQGALFALAAAAPVWVNYRRMRRAELRV